MDQLRRSGPVHNGNTRVAGCCWGSIFLKKWLVWPAFCFLFRLFFARRIRLLHAYWDHFFPYTTDWTFQVRSSEALFLGNTTPDVSFSLPGHTKSVRFVSSGCHQKHLESRGHKHQPVFRDPTFWTEGTDQAVYSRARWRKWRGHVGTCQSCHEIMGRRRSCATRNQHGWITPKPDTSTPLSHCFTTVLSWFSDPTGFTMGFPVENPWILGGECPVLLHGLETCEETSAGATQSSGGLKRRNGKLLVMFRYV